MKPWFEGCFLISARFDPRLRGELLVRPLAAYEKPAHFPKIRFYLEDGNHRALVYAVFLRLCAEAYQPVRVISSKNWTHLYPWAQLTAWQGNKERQRSSGRKFVIFSFFVLYCSNQFWVALPRIGASPFLPPFHRGRWIIELGWKTTMNILEELKLVMGELIWNEIIVLNPHSSTTFYSRGNARGRIRSVWRWQSLILMKQSAWILMRSKWVYSV